MWSAGSPWLARFLGDFLRAGDLYYQKGRPGLAAEMYARGGRPEQAARVARESGDVDGAVGYFQAAESPREAGELLAAEGRHREALAFFEQSRAWDRAAASCMALQMFERAAMLFEKAGQLRAAATAFDKGNQPDEALRVLEREARHLEGRQRYSPDDQIRNDQRQVDRHRAQLLARLNRHAEAAGILEAQGQHEAAGEMFERGGAVERAIRAYQAAGRSERAVALLGRARDLPLIERARLYRAAGRPAEAARDFADAGAEADAAECWEAAGEWAAAAEAWDRLAEPMRAGDLYFRIERWTEAARAFTAAGRHDLAARAWARVPEHEPAAAAWEAAARPLEAARHWLEAGRSEEASRALQTIPADHPEFDEATLLLVPLLVEEGLPDAALHRLDLLGGGEDVATGSFAVTRFYWEGRAREALGELGPARNAYGKAAALQRDFRDLSQRLRALADSGSTAVRRDLLRDTAPVPVAGVERAAGAARPQGEPLAVGDVLAGRYEVRSEIGRGGMGRVYEVWDRELEETVALKTLLALGGASDVEQERLLREVQICRRITHPNVVRIYDLGRFAGGIFVTMERLEGETLDRVLRARGPLPLGQIKEILQQALAGLAEAHRLRVVHRDLKPSNLFLDRRLKLLDFGIARIEGGDVDLTLPGEVLGSPKYMSPEQIQGDTLDGRSDLYSLGVLLFTMLAGREPFTGKTASAIAIKHLRDPPPDVSQWRPELPAEWRAVLERLMCKARDERYGSAAEALAAVNALPV